MNRRPIVFAGFVCAMVTFLAPHVCAQQPTESEAAAKIHRANRKLLIGAGLLGAAAFTLPVTASDAEWSGSAGKTGLGLVVAGTGLVVWGVRERQQALRPETTVAIFVGRSNGVRFRRAWP